ncbi:MAG: hypothetical protein J5604_00245 [Bacteroidales bacterium]|nr:hypothetical protein [Bacteroidales bacterium]
MKAVRFIARYIVGIVFIVSGFLKAVDPVGTALKVNEYSQAYLGTGFGSYATWIAVALCAVEFLTGVCVLKVIKFRFFSLIALLLSLFFLIVTFVSALTGKVSDCGCFGEVIKLEPWPSFFKNVVLSVLALFLYLNRKKARPIANRFWEITYIFAYTVAIVALSVYALKRLPPADLTDFRPGRDLMVSDTTALVKYKTEILYSKDGKMQKFDLKHLPDSTWKYEKTISTVIEGSEKYAKRMSFLLKDASGEDVTKSVLSLPNPIIMVSVYDASTITEEDLSKLKNLADSLDTELHKAEVFLVSALTEEQTLALVKPIADAVEHEKLSDIYATHYDETKVLPFDIVYSDYKTVITFNRSNGGATYIKNAQILRKWSASAYNNKKIIKALSEDYTLVAVRSAAASRIFLIVSLIVIILLVIILRVISKLLYKAVVNLEEITE